MAGDRSQTSRERALELAHEFGVSITSSLLLEETLALIAQRTGEAVDAWECDLYEYSPEKGRLTATAFWSRDPVDADVEWIGTVVDIADRPTYQTVIAGKRVVEDRLDDPALPSRERELMETWGEKTALTVPLVFRDEVIGCLVVLEKREVRSFTPQEVYILRELAVPAAIAIHNARMYRRQEDRTRHLSSLLDASRAITSSVVFEDVLDLVAENAAETLGSPECLIYEYDAPNDAVVARSFYARAGHVNPDFDPEIGTSFSLDDYPTDRFVLTGGTPIIERVSDEHLPEDVRASMEMWDEKSALTVPLIFHDQPLGLMELVETETERQFTGEEIDLACGLGEQAAVAIHNARLFRQREEQNRRLVTLLEASQAITGSLDAAEVIRRVTGIVGRLFPETQTAAEISLRIDDRLYFPFKNEEAFRKEGLPGDLVAGPDALAAAAIERLEPAQESDKDGQRLVVPLVLNHRAEGFLDLVCLRPAPFTEDEVQLVQLLVNHAATALENADNYGRLETMYLETVTALAAAMEAKDHYTAEHADMLAAMAVSVGRRLGLAEPELRELQYAAVLHDIGKIGIPGSILNKPDRLTDDEFEVMAEHTVIGERIISRVEYLEPIAGIIRAAHERWDGGGYPDRVASDDIPLAARILLVCDAFHAMTSDRPYRKALPEKVAVKELEKNAGTQFDPRVVESFLAVYPDFEVAGGESALGYALPVWRDRKKRTGASKKKPA